MKEFILASLPFVITGICLTVMMCANHRRKKDARNYLSKTMCPGICIGVAVSASFHINMGNERRLGNT